MYGFIGALIVVFAIGMLIRWAIKKRKASRAATPAEPPPPPASSSPGQPSVFCPQCGQPNTGDSAFCGSCGAKLK